MTAARSVFAFVFAIMLRPNSAECEAQNAPSRARTLTTAEVAARAGDADWKIIDVRDSNAFNGWITDDEKRGGHIRGAENLSLRWTETHPREVAQLIESKGLNEHQLVLYGTTAPEARRMAIWLETEALISPEQMFIYEEGLTIWSRDEDLPMDRLPRYEKLVPARWVRELSEEANAEQYRIVEVAWRKPQPFAEGHIPGAVYLDTDEIEALPLWNVVSPERLEETLLSLGITKTTKVVLYSRDSTAAARAALVLMYCGVDDVRLLNGGYRAWQEAGYPQAVGTALRDPAKSFGAKIPAQPQWIIGTDEAKKVLAAPDGRLVSIRSWPEYIGQTSGYKYIEPKGRIPGALWGHAGSDRDSMEDYRNPDDTMRDPREIAANWRAWGIEPDDQISFYCGTGWRASEAFFAAHLMGYENISVYDGGWFEWSADESNPQAEGPPQSEPSALQAEAIEVRIEPN